ncbi:sensor histidine kinase [Roseivirga sp.]|uniref:sensor histidine kinase n=1 Tax=Roseivirga sp. TaxID=1964215 RepID=UPI002B26628A|nr:sensor histidine kinase [Roseivirga sp.]
MTVNAQESPFSPGDFRQHFDQAEKLSRASLYSECIDELTKSIKLAQLNHLEKEEIQATIFLAETLRKTKDYDKGAALLLRLKNTEKYPLEHVKKLGRLAAIYHESSFDDRQQTVDSVSKYINLGLEFADSYDFEIEKALLKNEFGHLIGGSDALPYHLEAAQLFLKNNDRHNYVGALTKVLNIYQNTLYDYGKADSIIQILLKETEGKNWHTAEVELFNIIAYQYILKSGDSLNYFKWQNKASNSLIKYNAAIGSERLDNFRVQQETLNFQNEAINAQLALTQQEIRTRNLFIYLSILIVIILSIAILFYRELILRNKLKVMNQQLETANKQYQMLMIESNHRIKNNLQMVISMFEFAENTPNASDLTVIKRMSRKIQTISALHKHLYADVHNEKVSLELYFNEIIKLYSDLSTTKFIISHQFESAEIRSQRIVYFGLIFNEMLSNTMEHSKAATKQAHIEISKTNEWFTFYYKDNSPWDSNYKEGTGSVLIRQLVERVGGFDFLFDPKSGQFNFSFHV